MEGFSHQRLLRRQLSESLDLNEALAARIEQLKAYIWRAGLEVPRPEDGVHGPIVERDEAERPAPAKRLRTEHPADRSNGISFAALEASLDRSVREAFARSREGNGAGNVHTDAAPFDAAPASAETTGTEKTRLTEAREAARIGARADTHGDEVQVDASRHTDASRQTEASWTGEPHPYASHSLTPVRTVSSAGSDQQTSHAALPHRSSSVVWGAEGAEGAEVANVAPPSGDEDHPMSDAIVFDAREASAASSAATRGPLVETVNKAYAIASPQEKLLEKVQSPSSLRALFGYLTRSHDGEEERDSGPKVDSANESARLGSSPPHASAAPQRADVRTREADEIRGEIAIASKEAEEASDNALLRETSLTRDGTPSNGDAEGFSSGTSAPNHQNGEPVAEEIPPRIGSKDSSPPAVEVQYSAASPNAQDVEEDEAGTDKDIQVQQESRVPASRASDSLIVVEGYVQTNIHSPTAPRDDTVADTRSLPAVNHSESAGTWPLPPNHHNKSPTHWGNESVPVIPSKSHAIAAPTVPSSEPRIPRHTKTAIRQDVPPLPHKPNHKPRDDWAMQFRESFNSRKAQSALQRAGFPQDSMLTDSMQRFAESARAREPSGEHTTASLPRLASGPGGQSHDSTKSLTDTTITPVKAAGGDSRKSNLGSSPSPAPESARRRRADTSQPVEPKSPQGQMSPQAHSPYPVKGSPPAPPRDTTSRMIVPKDAPPMPPIPQSILRRLNGLQGSAGDGRQSERANLLASPFRGSVLPPLTSTPTPKVSGAGRGELERNATPEANSSSRALPGRSRQSPGSSMYESALQSFDTTSPAGVKLGELKTWQDRGDREPILLKRPPGSRAADSVPVPPPVQPLAETGTGLGIPLKVGRRSAPSSRAAPSEEPSQVRLATRIQPMPSVALPSSVSDRRVAFKLPSSTGASQDSPEPEPPRAQGRRKLVRNVYPVDLSNVSQASLPDMSMQRASDAGDISERRERPPL